MGTIDEESFTTSITPSRAPPPLKPTIVPALQAPRNTVISVVLGDYHLGALTSSGKLLTWGTFSKGALGLGDPLELDVGQPGGFEREDVKEQARSAWTERGIGIDNVGAEPGRVGVPTEVQFDHSERKRKGEEKGKKERYCFGATAGGWHMGALVIDLEPDEEDFDAEQTTEEDQAREENDDSSADVRMPGAFNPVQPALPLHPAYNPAYGATPFRIGFAGRALGRGGLGRGRFHTMGRGGAPDQM